MTTEWHYQPEQYKYCWTVLTYTLASYTHDHSSLILLMISVMNIDESNYHTHVLKYFLQSNRTLQTVLTYFCISIYTLTITKHETTWYLVGWGLTQATSTNMQAIAICHSVISWWWLTLFQHTHTPSLLNSLLWKPFLLPFVFENEDHNKSARDPSSLESCTIFY